MFFIMTNNSTQSNKILLNNKRFILIFSILLLFSSLKSQIVGDTMICAGDTATYTAPFYTGSAYLWSVTGGTAIPSGNTCKITWGNTTYGTINVLISGHGFLTLTVVIRPKPAISFVRTQGVASCGNSVGSAPDESRCDFNACEFSREVYTANYNATYSYFWQVLGGTIIAGQFTNQITIQWGAVGNGSIKCFETTQYGCSDSLSKCVKKVALPIAKFSANGVLNGGTINICKGGNVNFIDSSSGNTYWNWWFGDGGFFKHA